MELLMNPFGPVGNWFLPFLLNCFLIIILYCFIVSFGSSKGKKKELAVFFIILNMYSVLIFYNKWTGIAALVFYYLILFLFACFMLKQSYTHSFLMVLVVYIVEQCALGVSQPVSYILFSGTLDIASFYWRMVVTFLLPLIFCAAMYWIILIKIRIKSVRWNSHLQIVWLPVLFVLLLYQLSSMGEGWNMTTVINTEKDIAQMTFSYSFREAIQIFLISVTGFAGIVSILFAYVRTTEYFDIENRKTLLEQQISVQKSYLEEAKLRLSQTLSFRHDFKNHLSVITGLLEKKRLEEAGEYLAKMETVTEQLSFDCNSGNAAVDALLSNKLSLAKQFGINVFCDVKIPKELSADAFDLCIIFSNAVDNAINACKAAGDKKTFINLSSKTEGSFLIIECVNSFRKDKKAKGTGLGISNMKETARKYNGALTIEMRDDCFILNILLVLSEQKRDITEQMS